MVYLAASLAPVTVWAQDADPFQFDQGRWMSFERYNDYQKRGVKPNVIQVRPDYDKEDKDIPQTVGTAPQAMQGDASPAGGTVAQAANASSNHTAVDKGADDGKAQAMAEPSRPLNLPELPGVNKGFSINVQSTSDTADTRPATASIVSADGKPDFKLHEQNWQHAEEVIKNVAAANADVDDDRRPINVRPSFLPNPDISPVTAPTHPSARSARIAHALEKEPLPKPKATPAQAENQAVCAAIDSYKKKQVEALQSDRQTLLALQSAIADLGLQKQLNFMTGAQGPVANQPTNHP